MSSQTLRRARHGSERARADVCVREREGAMRLIACILFAACILFNVKTAGAQASQASNSSKSAQQSSQAQPPKANGQAPASGPASAPMVMGEDPDSGDMGSAPAQAAPAQQPAGAAAPGKIVLWNPAIPPGEPAAEPPAAAPEAALPVPPPADAGGDIARQQINNQCVDLLKLANDLKAAVDKSNQDMLSVAVVRKANEIETLAHHVKDEIKPEVGKK